MDGNSWWYLSRFSGQANARAHRHQDGSTFDGQWQGGDYITSIIFSSVVAKHRFMMANAELTRRQRIAFYLNARKVHESHAIGGRVE
jgi:hypothetical protein